MFHKNHLTIVSLLLGMLIVPTAVFACSMCVEAQLWYAYPPIVQWKWAGLLWFVSLVVIQNLSGNLVPRFPQKIISPMIGLVVTGFLAIAFLASLPLIALSLFCIRPMVGVYKKESPNLSRKSRIAVYASGIIPLLIVIGTITAEALQPTPRDAVSVILATSGTSVHRQKIQELARQKPFPDETFEQLMEVGDSYNVWMAMQHLLKQENWEEYIPLCIDSLERFESDIPNQDCYGLIESSLSEKTSIKLPDNSPARKWREAWKARQVKQQRTNQQP